LKMNYLNPNCFEKTKEAVGFFSFFSFTNVETKNVCPIAYNGFGLGEVALVRWLVCRKPFCQTRVI
jgi:hypothetical protein